MKTLISLILLFMPTFVFAQYSELAIDSPVLFKDDEEVAVAPPILYQDMTMIPSRTLAIIFDAEAEWDGENVIISMSRFKIKVTPNSNKAIVNNFTMQMPAEVLLYDGTSYLPMRFFCELLEGDLDYDDEQLSVYWEPPPKELRLNDPFSILAYETPARIGDSYFSYSIDAPTPFQLTYCSDDGTTLDFIAWERDATMQITVLPPEDAAQLGALLYVEPEYIAGTELFVLPDEPEYPSYYVAVIIPSGICVASLEFEPNITLMNKLRYINLVRSVSDVFTQNVRDITSHIDGRPVVYNREGGWFLPIDEDFSIEVSSATNVSFTSDKDSTFTIHTYRLLANQNIDSVILNMLDLVKATYNEDAIRNLQSITLNFGGNMTKAITYTIRWDERNAFNKQLIYLQDNIVYSIEYEIENNSADFTRNIRQIEGLISKIEFFPPVRTPDEAHRSTKRAFSVGQTRFWLPVDTKITRIDGGVSMLIGEVDFEWLHTKMFHVEHFEDVQVSVQKQVLFYFDEYRGTNFLKTATTDRATYSFEYVYDDTEYLFEQSVFTARGSVFTSRCVVPTKYASSARLKLINDINLALMHK